MYRGPGPRIFPIIVIILVIALVVAALVSVGRMLFAGGDSSSGGGETTDAVVTALRDTSQDRSVRWTVRGPIVADENFRSYQITVGPNSRTYTVYAGYLEQVLDTKTYSNNFAGYEQFVFALDKAGVGVARDAKNAEIRGVCATQGFAYVVETLNDDKPDHMLWTTSCSGSKGTMVATVPQVHALFVNQIPDFEPVFNRVY
ncbi:hypothetical protein EOL96_04175 [Candidatus Saccharibacteria bacterium]|nr:hypothetical protein [Candidatus Saccharibacteria bacterium]